MALSLDSIYQPLNDFFLNHFKTDAQSTVFFRFDKFGSVISDHDFIDPISGIGYSSAKAIEKFSDIVNHIPLEDEDGLNIMLSQNEIDTEYFYQLLNPSIPFIPDGTDDENKESIINAFNLIKADAIKNWVNITSESITGSMFKFKPSLAIPENWFDKTNNESWVTQSFKISDTTVKSPENVQKLQLWKLKVDDDVMQNILKQSNEIKSIEPKVEPSPKHIEIKGLIANKIIQPESKIKTGITASKFVHLQPKLVTDIAANKVIKSDNQIRFSDLNVNQRIFVNNDLINIKPTQPVNTNEISISFDYCIVNIKRPWYFNVFINNKSWYIPNIVKGLLSTKDNNGINLNLITTGFIAIKNLNIEANWSTEDIELSKNATDFGPFKVGSEIINNKLAHEGIQIIGWILQKMPELPPNDPPDTK